MDQVEQNQLIVVPICLNFEVVKLVPPANEHVELPAGDLRHKRSNYLLNEFFRQLSKERLLEKLLFLDLHSLNLVLIIVPHDVSALNYRLYDQQSFVVFGGHFLLLNVVFDFGH